MILGKVVGHVVSTQKNPKLIGSKLLIVNPIKSKSELYDTTGNSEKEIIITVDMIGAGVGETVIVTQDYAAANAAGDPESPVNAAIIGIVDTVDIF